MACILSKPFNHPKPIHDVWHARAVHRVSIRRQPVGNPRGQPDPRAPRGMVERSPEAPGRDQ